MHIEDTAAANLSTMRLWITLHTLEVQVRPANMWKSFCLHNKDRNSHEETSTGRVKTVARQDFLSLAHWVYSLCNTRLELPAFCCVRSVRRAEASRLQSLLSRQKHNSGSISETVGYLPFLFYFTACRHISFLISSFLCYIHPRISFMAPNIISLCCSTAVCESYPQW